VNKFVRFIKYNIYKPPKKKTQKAVRSYNKNTWPFVFALFNGVSIKEFIDILDRCLIWYNENMIRLTLGALNQMDYRVR